MTGVIWSGSKLDAHIDHKANGWMGRSMDKFMVGLMKRRQDTLMNLPAWLALPHIQEH